MTDVLASICGWCIYQFLEGDARDTERVLSCEPTPWPEQAIENSREAA